VIDGPTRGRAWSPAGVRVEFRRLAAAAGVDLLAVQFDGCGAGARFAGAHLWPDISQPEIADAVAAYLRAAPHERRRS
jgi:hypothetical protein